MRRAGRSARGCRGRGPDPRGYLAPPEPDARAGADQRPGSTWRGRLRRYWSDRRTRQEQAAWRHDWDRVLLAHLPGAAPTQAARPDPRAPGRLAQALGAGLDGAQALIDALNHPTWVALDLLPTLVLGSTPAAPMMLRRAATGQPAQYGPEWRAAVLPFKALFDGTDWPEARLDGETQALFAHAKRATALGCTREETRPPRLCLRGRATARVRLAQDLRAVRGLGPATEDYLARLIAGGERHHLRRCLEALSGRAADLPLHLEAAAMLLGERLDLTGRGPGVAVADGAPAPPSLDAALAPDWEALGRALSAPLPGSGPNGPDGLTPTLAAHCWCLWLAALERLEPATGPDGTACPRPRLEAALGDLEWALERGLGAAVSVEGSQAGGAERGAVLPFAVPGMADQPAGIRPAGLACGRAPVRSRIGG